MNVLDLIHFWKRSSSSDLWLLWLPELDVLSSRFRFKRILGRLNLGSKLLPSNSNGWSSSSAPRAPSPSASAVALYHNNRGLSLKGTRVVFFFLSPQQEGLPQWQGPLPNPYASVQVQGKPLWPSNRRFHLRFDPRSQVYMVINLS